MDTVFIKRAVHGIKTRRTFKKFARKSLVNTAQSCALFDRNRSRCVQGAHDEAFSDRDTWKMEHWDEWHKGREF